MEHTPTKLHVTSQLNQRSPCPAVFKGYTSIEGVKETIFTTGLSFGRDSLGLSLHEGDGTQELFQEPVPAEQPINGGSEMNGNIDGPKLQHDADLSAVHLFVRGTSIEQVINSHVREEETTGE